MADDIDTDDHAFQPLGNVAKRVVTRLRDLHGYGQFRDWGLQLAADLTAYSNDQIDWADVDSGALLVGPPGCGKTFGVKALAEECGVPLIESSYGDWESGAGRGNLVVAAIKKCFADARYAAPCILFIDELDTVGSRGTRAHNSGWFDAIVNGLLAELDGAIPRPGVVVIGATNHVRSIDPALLRPGRLGRTIIIPPPSISDMRGIIRFHLGEAAGDAGLDDAARACRGRSPAEIAQLAREARRTARQFKRPVCAGDLGDIAFLSRPARTAEEDFAIAYHETGHALIAHFTGIEIRHVDLDQQHVRHVAAGGHATMEDVKRHIALSMGGMAADSIFGAGATLGSAGDVEDATALALSALTRGLGPRLCALPPDHALMDTRLQADVDRMLREGLETATALLRMHEPVVTALARELVKRRYLDASEVAAVVRDVQGRDDPLAGLRH